MVGSGGWTGRLGGVICSGRDRRALVREQQACFRGQAVATAAAQLLVQGLERARWAVVYDAANVSLVDAHPKGVGSHHHRAAATARAAAAFFAAFFAAAILHAEESALRLRTLRGGHARVVS